MSAPPHLPTQPRSQGGSFIPFLPVQPRCTPNLHFRIAQRFCGHISRHGRSSVATTRRQSWTSNAPMNVPPFAPARAGALSAFSGPRHAMRAIPRTLQGTGRTQSQGSPFIDPRGQQETFLLLSWRQMPGSSCLLEGSSVRLAWMST